MKKGISGILARMSVFLLFYVIGISTCYATPAITGVSGTFNDGQTITLSGSGFGSNAAVGTSNLEFLGGAAGPINSGTTGASFSRTNWDVDTEWGGNMIYSTNNVGFGAKCLQMTGGGAYPEVPMYYRLPTPVPTGDHIFTSWWERTTWAGSGQYKVIRFSPTETIVDAPGQQDVFFYHNNSGGTTFGIDGGPYALYPTFSPATPQSTWSRMDVDMATSSSGAGTVTLTKYTPGSPLQTISTSKYTSQGSSNLAYVVWQNYFGTDGAGTMTAGVVWLEDLFIQHGSPARVELCDSSTWASRKTCFIQPPTSWGSSVSVTLNKGTFASGSTAYLYAIDSSGNVSNGQPITIGSGGTSSVPPTVSISSPSSNAAVSGTVSITANASDSVGVTRVEFYVNGVLQTTDTSTPYLCSWNTTALAAGTYTLSAKAYDAAGNVGTSGNVSVTIVKNTTAPTVAVTAPANNAAVSGTALITATASDQVGVTNVQFYLDGTLLSSGNVTPYSCSWNTTTVANGSHTLSSKAYDAAGNIGQSANVTVTVSNQGTTSSTYSLWPASAVPATVDAGSDGAEELGVKFRSDVKGYITGVRFYKASANTGTHIGNLWTSTGTRLATATFSNETASGWQQVNFSTPVAITANTVYVASYHNIPGHLSVGRNFFATSGMDNAPLHALASGVSGSNGVYAYGSSSLFPNQTYENTNYWVDVVFNE